MFIKGKKRGNTYGHIAITGQEGCVLYEGSLLEAPIDDEYIISKCIEYFDDSNPCFIHRSAAANRIAFEMEEQLKDLALQKGCGVEIVLENDDIPELIKKTIKGMGKIKRIEFKWYGN